ncbi:MAG: hypothetical protein MJY93_01355 [Fibrobacter sp.]|nr:hypothetical protein [Fibrobacter sp.]
MLGVVPSFAQDAQEAVSSSEPSIVESSSSEVVESSSSETVSSSSEEVAASSSSSVEESSSSSSEVSSSSSAKTGGMLGALYPVEPDETISKGHIYSGLTLSLIQANSEDDALNIMIGDVYEAYGYTFTLEAFGGYFVKDAMAIGMRAGYSRTWYDIDFSLLEDLLDMKQHRKYVSNGFFFQPMLKNYFKVISSRNLYVFNETSIKLGYSYGISQSDNGEDLDKSKNSSWSIEVGINPGICIMVLDRFAFETSVGLLGLSTSVLDVEENGKSHSRVVANVVNFTINLLALNFSLVAFF